jgi:hypothetical protein
LTGNGGARQTLKLKIPSHAFARSPRRPVRPLLLRTALFFLCVGPVLAQGETQGATQDTTTQDATQGEYQGPSVLSRGSLSTIGGQISQFGFRPFAGVGGIYDSGLTFTSVDSSGKPTNIDDYGVQVQVGAGLHRSWRKTSLGLDYRGDFRHYARTSYFDGSDNMFALGLNRQLGRRWNLSLREAAGTFTRAFGSLTGYGFYDPNQIVTPVNEFFDNRTTYASTAGDLTYQKSARLSFNAGADAFLVRRHAQGLLDVNGIAARGDMVYRYNRHGAVGADYRFMHVDYVNGFGTSDIHTAGINYSLRFSRRWEVALHVGMSRVETVGLTQVAIDPAIAIILGIKYGAEVVRLVNYVPDFYGRLTHSLRHGVFQFSYINRVNPGSAIFRLAQQNSAQAEYNYTGLRHWYLAARAGYNSMRTLTQAGGNYEGYTVGTGITRVLRRDIHAQFRFDLQRYEGGFENTIRRNRARITVGLIYSPGEMPLRFW